MAPRMSSILMTCQPRSDRTGPTIAPLRGGESGVGDGVPGQAGEFGAGLRADADVLGRKAGGRGGGDEARPRPGARGDGVGLALVLDDRLADHPGLAAGIGRLVGLVIGRDLGIGRGDVRDRFRPDLGDAQDPLFGHHVALAGSGYRRIGGRRPTD